MIDLPTIVWFAATGSSITTESKVIPLLVRHLEFTSAPRLELAYRDAIGHTLRRAHMSKARDNLGLSPTPASSHQSPHFHIKRGICPPSIRSLIRADGR